MGRNVPWIIAAHPGKFGRKCVQHPPNLGRVAEDGLDRKILVMKTKDRSITCENGPCPISWRSAATRTAV